MHGLVTIARKELLLYRTTPIGYVVLGLHAFIMGLLFVSSVSRFQRASELLLARQQAELLEQLNFNDAIVAPMLSSGVWLFLLFVPMLTMRLVAEERSTGTFELLMTTPVSSIDIVLGKFAGVSAVLLAMALLPTLFPILLHLHAARAGAQGVEWAPVFSGCLALMLVAAQFAALGLLISAITDSQVVAATGTFATLTVLSLLPSLAARVEGTAATLVEYVGPLAHVGRGIQGRLHLADVVYFVSTTAFLLILCVRVVESRRWR